MNHRNPGILSCFRWLTAIRNGGLTGYCPMKKSPVFVRNIKSTIVDDTILRMPESITIHQSEYKRPGI